MKNRGRIWRKFFEILASFALVCASFALAFLFRVGKFESSDFPFEPFFKLALGTSAVFVLLFFWGGVFSFAPKNLLEKFRAISLSCLAGSTFFVLVFFFNREVFFSRLIVLLIFLFSTFLVWGFFATLFFLDWRSWKRGVNVARVLIIGANRAAGKAIAHLQKNFPQKMPVAILAPHGSGAKSIHGVKVLGKLDCLESVVREQRIDEILQADCVEQCVNILLFCEANLLGFLLAPEILGAFSSQVFSQNLGGKSFLALKFSPLFGWGQVAKRLFDLVVSTFFLVIFSPIFLLIFIFRKMLAPRTACFCAVTRARGVGETFQLWNFHAPENSPWGKILKRTFLLHLPEFFNVFFGQMSLVGPRPMSQDFREKLPAHFRKRLILKPGMFGLWQLEKLRGAGDDFEKMFACDIWHIQNWTFLLDLKILAKSFGLVVRNIFKIRSTGGGGLAVGPAGQASRR